MLYHLLYPLHYSYGFFRVFGYITFRIVMAILTSLLISFVLGPGLIKFLKRKQIGQHIREEGPKAHQAKAGTPTMGGILIVFSFLLSFLSWARLNAWFPWIVTLSTLGFASIGFYDDVSKLLKKNNKGLTISGKFRLQVILAAVVGILLVMAGLPTDIHFPFFKDFTIHLHASLFVLFVVLVVVGSSNAVNLTDGLDGLAIGPTLVASFTYLILAYIAGHAKFSDYLQLAHVPGSGEVAIFCGAMVGAGLGFLWFNTYPAQVFMGDVGSLSLGAAIGTVALIIKQEILLIIVGGVFVLEAVSVIVQVISFRTTGKRVFKMAPIHHHFELKGWAEPKVIVRFWIVSIILALVALTTLKLR